ncbi:hypothetical protein [Paenibacillus oryzisoli]|uniref:Uncharacterized protein n=1 Tax=Paenibacillus oryzisoli TaxID=1850517 RepID=A0A198A654_9BACL|nr:hypothetical protein [Paenibacillus oryzisoli]OAS16974.1 hypothetical protein A8708_01745 [Paenibacillus oryzisoli]
MQEEKQPEEPTGATTPQKLFSEVSTTQNYPVFLNRITQFPTLSNIIIISTKWTANIVVISEKIKLRKYSRKINIFFFTWKQLLDII